MTPRREPLSARLRLALLTVLTALATLLSPAALASASGLPATETRVGVSTLAAPDVVGVHQCITAGQHWVRGPSQLRLVVGHCVAAETALPEALTVGKNAETGVQVYTGVRDGKDVYAGITNNLVRRQAQHGDRFVLQQLTESGVTRGEARSIEQALIVRNPGFENQINSISPSQPYYQQAVDWGESWPKTQGH